jgi:hypothetical protein
MAPINIGQDRIFRMLEWQYAAPPTRESMHEGGPRKRSSSDGLSVRCRPSSSVFSGMIVFLAGFPLENLLGFLELGPPFGRQVFTGPIDEVLDHADA